MSQKHRVYTASANPSVDKPTYSLRASEADYLVDVGRAVRLGRRRIQMLAEMRDPGDVVITSTRLAELGYDDASKKNPQLNFDDAWIPRPSDGFRMYQLHPPFFMRVRATAELR